MPNVFVYGTLKGGNKIRGLHSTNGADFVGSATTTEAAFDLSSLGHFPAAELHGEYRIKGEVWSVDDDTMQQLDRIEGYPDFYNRAEVMTTRGKAWMYYIDNIDEYNRDYNQDITQTGDTLEWQQ